MLNDLIERVKSVFTKPQPVQFAPPLSREKESAMVKFFDTRSALLHDLTIDNYCDAKKAEWDIWLFEMDAQAEVVNAHLASKEAK